MGKPTGGTITIDGEYTVHTFESSGTISFPKGGLIDVLVVGGGGPGGKGHSGGGGAGGVIYETDFSVSAGSYAVTVGAGGKAHPHVPILNGGNSVFSTLTAVGGGAGWCYLDTDAQDGGSGGGGAYFNGANHPPGDGTDGQGYDGGTSYRYGEDPYVLYQGGGGGAGEVGGSGFNMDGGDGIACDITGASIYYGGGGGGTRYHSQTGAQSGGAGGNGGGGASYATYGEDGTDGLGGGGGACMPDAAGDGGSGVVIIRYKTALFSAGGLFTFHG